MIGRDLDFDSFAQRHPGFDLPKGRWRRTPMRIAWRALPSTTGMTRLLPPNGRFTTLRSTRC